MKTYDISGGWGDMITLFGEWKQGSSTQRVYGFKSRIPRVEDLLRLPMASGKVLLTEFIKIEKCEDPKDMFFADIKVLGYEGEINDKRRKISKKIPLHLRTIST